MCAWKDESLEGYEVGNMNKGLGLCRWDGEDISKDGWKDRLYRQADGRVEREHRHSTCGSARRFSSYWQSTIMRPDTDILPRNV